ncbi:MAG: DoxX family protein [Alphaproteobacteria bacterium]|nr:DoxX family protein [Alphaproteobacteria bacterium]
MKGNESGSGLLGLVAAVINLLGQVPEALLLLAGRIAVGSVFLKSGLTKIDIETWQIAPTTFDLFREEYRVPVLSPELAAYLGTFTELTMPFLLFFGLGARAGAGVLLGMTFVIQVFVYPESWSDHLLWATILLSIISRGPGLLSADHVLAGLFFERQVRYAR